MADQLDINRLTAFDSAGDPVSGAKAYFYETGTTTPVTVYSDAALSVAHPSPLVADSSGVFDAVYYGASTAVKVRVDTSADVEVYTIDPVRRVAGEGAAASAISFAPTTEIPSSTVQAAIEQVQANATVNFEVVEKTAGYTVLATDKTKLIRCTSTLTLALTAAATLGDGFTFKVQADGGDVTIDPNSTETINGASTLTLSDTQSADISCDGSGFFASISYTLIDEDDLSTDSATQPPSQQSVKAYVDALPVTEYFESAEQTITAGGTLTLAHGLSAAPYKSCDPWLICKSAELGYSVGDQFPVNPHLNANSASSFGQSLKVDATNVTVRFGVTSGVYVILRGDTGAAAAIDPTKWKLIVRAMA